MQDVEIVELWPTYAQATAARKRYARAGSPRRFGARVLSFPAWAEELWLLAGDGRARVTSVERDVILAGVLAQGGALRCNAGTVRLLADVVGEGAGLAEYERACAGDAAVDFTDAERAVLQAARAYRDLARRAGLVEYGEMLALLPRGLATCAVRWEVELCGFDALGEGERRFLDALAESGRARISVRDDGPVAGESAELDDLRATVFYRAQERTVRPTGAVRFALPTGRYATAPLLAREIASLAEEARSDQDAHSPRVVLSCADPLRTFEGLSARLAVQGLTCGVQGARPFGETAFGRAFGALVAFFHGPADARTGRMLTDFMESPFSGVPLEQAQRFDAQWRADRDLSHDAAALWKALGEQSEEAALMAQAAEEGDLAQIRPLLERTIRGRAEWSDACRSLQLAAVSLACEVGAAAQRFGVPISAVYGLLASRPVAVSASQDAAPDVLVCDEARAAQCTPGCAWAVVSADMSSAACPVRTERGVKQLLFAKLGIPDPPSALDAARSRFMRVLGAARKRVVLSRPLNTVDADESYPSVMYEEVIDCYRDRLDADDDLDRTYGVPACLLPWVDSCGEDALAEAVGDDGLPPEAVCACPQGATGEIDEGRKPAIVVSRIDAGSGKGTVALSATQIESYLECPYKWFALRRLRLDTPDAGFGALEMGILAHRALGAFYERLQADDPSARVLPETREACAAAAQDVFWECYERQRAGLSATRVAPQGELEMAQVRELAALVEEFVAGDADFLPGFRPAASEKGFGEKDPVIYAGRALRGSVDRIDVDDKGRAVVVDYKGAIGHGSSSPYLLVSRRADEQEGFVLPGKIQALVYAQIVRREMGLDVVGALYANYGTGSAAGAVDDRVIEPASARLAGPSAQRSCLSRTGFASFAALLDEVEERVGRALDAMEAGEIAACPRTPDACSYCPVAVCEKRMA